MSHFEIFLIILAFVVSLLVVGLTTGINGGPKCDSNSDTVSPPLMNDFYSNPLYLLVYCAGQYLQYSDDIFLKT